jgi:hypothetical protein
MQSRRFWLRLRRRRNSGAIIIHKPLFSFESEGMQMTSHRLLLTLWTTLFLAFGFLTFGQSPALSAECVVCERNFADCRMPAQAKMASCMNSEQSGCGNKCASDCKNDKEAQKCTIACVKSCQGKAACQATFASVNTQCTSTFRACKNGCTVTR